MSVCICTSDITQLAHWAPIGPCCKAWFLLKVKYLREGPLRFRDLTSRVTVTVKYTYTIKILNVFFLQSVIAVNVIRNFTVYHLPVITVYAAIFA